MRRSVELGFLDHFLVLVSCSTSLFALGESLQKHSLAIFLAVGSAVSILTGYWISRTLEGKKVKEWDAYLWTAFAFLAAVFSRTLNGFLPEEGFPFMLFAGTWLSWMVMMCGVFSWRDQTLLFLNLPCLSVFALVGTFDTFAPATVLFFIFLVCTSLLYARIHQRGMIRRAKQAGFDDPSLLERDSWRWMAGPEWAFASAGVIVLFSLVFGPILRFSLQPVSGSVNVTLPQATASNPLRSALADTDLPVGTGSSNLSEKVILRVKMERPDYLRAAVFVDYKGNGWSRLSTYAMASVPGLEQKILGDPGQWLSAWPKGVPFEPMQKPVKHGLTLYGPVVETKSLPAPGPVVRVRTEVPGDSIFLPTGIVVMRSSLKDGETADIEYLATDPSVTPGKAQLPPELRPVERYFKNSAGMEKVAVFARDAVKGARSDYEKAVLIQHAIERTCGYSTKVQAQSPNADAVEQFLFRNKVGYCDLFATAMVMCARTQGLPARYATGFLVQTKPDKTGVYPVRGVDSHAWAEVYFENAGWVKFDATEGAATVAEQTPERNLPWYKRRWVPYALVALAVAGLAALASRARSRVLPRATKSVKSMRLVAMRQHQEFDRILRKKTSVTRRFSQTTAEYVNLLVPRLGPVAPSALVLVQDFEHFCFGPLEPTKESVHELARKVKEFGREAARAPRT